MSKLLRRGAGWLAGSALFFCCLPPLSSHDPITTKLTWTREISRIVYKRCGSCHHQGGAAMALTNYAAARPWAKAIRDQILSRRMPPWGAVPGIREFAGDPSLSQPEIDMLVGWVEGGAPEGDAADLPAHLPVFKTQSPALPRYTRTVTVTAETTLTKAGSLVAIGAKDVPAGGSLEAWAVEPDGTVERLLWIKDSRHTRQYTLLTPLALPAGTRVRVAATGGHVILYLGGRV